jgi:hypothetical protein
MANFAGGSAFSMTQQIASGHLRIADRSFLRMQKADLDLLKMEMERRLRELRSVQVDQNDTQAIQEKSRSITRVNTAMTILNSYRQRRRI